jgi:hypothetical protein
MKNQFAQLVSFVNKIDRRHLQIAYFLVMLAGAVLLKSPSDGSIGPY